MQLDEPKRTAIFFIVYTRKDMAVRTISLMTANQEFSKLIKDVEQGEEFVITRRGRPIAKLSPHTADKTADPEWRAAYERMMAHLEEGASSAADARYQCLGLCRRP